MPSRMARDTNDYLAEAIKQASDALRRLRRAADRGARQGRRGAGAPRRVQGFKGAVINGHNRGRYLDDKFYWPILESAEELDVPIYLHPTRPPSR